LQRLHFSDFWQFFRCYGSRLLRHSPKLSKRQRLLRIHFCSHFFCNSR
jgi:hypothetical protein